MHEQHIFAPLDRLVAAGENLMDASAAEKTRPLETRPHAVAQAREAERHGVLLAIVAELDQAQDRRGVEAGNLAEIEHHVADRLVPLPVDDPLDPLEQPVRRAEENEAREPEDVDALALLAQEARLFRRPLDIARKILAREMTPDD